jgi:hypothetical protein
MNMINMTVMEMLRSVNDRLRGVWFLAYALVVVVVADQIFDPVVSLTSGGAPSYSPTMVLLGRASESTTCNTGVRRGECFNVVRDPHSEVAKLLRFDTQHSGRRLCRIICENVFARAALRSP